jgi:hypothetical protein
MRYEVEYGPAIAGHNDRLTVSTLRAVVMLHYRGFRELFMGDAGEESEAQLLAKGDTLRADVLKEPPWVRCGAIRLTAGLSPTTWLPCSPAQRVSAT